mgnify:FL=1
MEPINIRNLKDQFLEMLQAISKMELMINLAPFLQGEDALLLHIFLNGPTNPSILSSELKVTKGRITAIINSLSKKKYILIKLDSSDRRRVLVDLSNQGKYYLESKLTAADKHFERIFEKIGYESTKTFVESLNNVITIAKEVE